MTEKELFQHASPVDREVLAILSQCTIEGNLVRLPNIRLDRKLYERVNEVFGTIGGKWVGRKTQAHVFEESPAEVLDLVMTTGRLLRPKDFDFFQTPPELADKAIELADIQPGMRVLEPNAGWGALAIPAARIVGFDRVCCVELLPGNAKRLRDAGFTAVNQNDFLAFEPVPVFQRVLMNPPFSRLTDVTHIMHACRFLTPDGKLTAFTAPSWEFNQQKKAQAFRDFMDECEGEVHAVEAGAFHSSGTEIATRIITLDATNFPWHRQAPKERMRA